MLFGSLRKGGAGKRPLGPDWVKLPKGDPRFPPRLEHLEDCPAELTIRGDLECLSQLGVAIVGSRRPTGYGVHVARELAGPIARRGIPVISGMARGIDAAAHLAALEAGGKTIAVMGTGPDLVYPKEHRALADRIASSGALVTEFPPGTAPLKHHFPQRNRIIAALATAVVVVEAGIPSGSIITANQALDLGRTVVAVPGRINDPKSQGTLNLIYDGATPIRRLNDLLFALGLPDENNSENRNPQDQGLDPFETGLLELMKNNDPLSLDALLAQARSGPDRVLTALFSLEVGGFIESLPGGLYRRR